MADDDVFLIKGNEAADEHARSALWLHPDLIDELSEQAIRDRDRVRQMCKLAAGLLPLWPALDRAYERRRSGAGPRVRRTVQERLVDISLHSGIVFEAGRVSCTACGQCSQAVYRVARAWLAKPCLAMRSTSGECPLAFPQGDMQVGRHVLHGSHRLAVAGPYVFCTVCGSWATAAAGKSRPRKLLVVCSGPTLASAGCLRRLLAGKAPVAALVWKRSWAVSWADVKLMSKTHQKFQNQKALQQ